MTRLRPAPHGGSIDVTPIAASAFPALAANVADAAPASGIACSKASCPGDTEITLVAPAAQADVNVVDHSSPETPIDASAGVVEDVAASSAGGELVDIPAVIRDEQPAELPESGEPAVLEAAPVASIAVEIEPVDAPEPAIVSNPALEFQADLEPIVTEDMPVAVAAIAAAPAVSGDNDACPGLATDVEPAVAADPPVAIADSEVSAEDVAESSIDGASSLARAAAQDTTVALKDSSTETPSVVTDVAAEPSPASPVAEIRSVRKPRAKVAEPTDRAALIRQRWAETGIRMWNPRLHGSGEATLNIQGSIGLLPPAPGETMPRYDKLEFRMLGGQIACEGVIVEAPAPIGHRSFTRLAEPAKPERAREPLRERQAALA